MPATRSLQALLDSLRDVTGVRARYHFGDGAGAMQEEKRSEFCGLFHQDNPNAVATCGDFHAEGRAAARYVTQATGGHGAVREFCDLLLVASGRYAQLLERYA